MSRNIKNKYARGKSEILGLKFRTERSHQKRFITGRFDAHSHKLTSADDSLEPLLQTPQFIYILTTELRRERSVYVAAKLVVSGSRLLTVTNRMNMTVKVPTTQYMI